MATSLAQRTMESEAIASIYEGRLWRRNPIATFFQRISYEDEYELVATALDVAPDAIVIDVGCGPGLYTRPLARRAADGNAFGFDISCAMLRQAKKLANSESVPNVGFARATAERLPVASGCAGAVVCCGAIHLFADADRALAEMHRVLEPGAPIAIGTFRRNAGMLAAHVTRLRRKHSGMDAYLPEEMDERLRAQGFHDVTIHHARGTWLIVSARKDAGAASPAS